MLCSPSLLQPLDSSFGNIIEYYDKERESEMLDLIEKIPFSPTLTTNGPSSSISSGSSHSYPRTPITESSTGPLDPKTLQHMNSQLRRSYGICARRCREYEKDCDNLRQEIYKLKQDNHRLVQEIGNIREELILKSKGEGSGLEILRGQLFQNKSKEYEANLKKLEQLRVVIDEKNAMVEKYQKEKEIVGKVENKEINRLIEELANSNTLLKTRSLENHKLKEEIQHLKDRNYLNEGLITEKEKAIENLEKQLYSKQSQSLKPSKVDLLDIKELIEMEKQKIIAKKDIEIEEIKNILNKKNEANLKKLTEYCQQIKQQLEENDENLRKQKDKEIENMQKLRKEELNKLRHQMMVEKEKQIQSACSKITKEKDKHIEELRKKILDLKEQFFSESSNCKQYEQRIKSLQDELREMQIRNQSLTSIREEYEKLKTFYENLKKRYLSRNEKFHALRKKNIYLVNGCDKLKTRSRYLEELNKRLVQKAMLKEDLERSLTAQLELLTQRQFSFNMSQSQSTLNGSAFNLSSPGS